MSKLQDLILAGMGLSLTAFCIVAAIAMGSASCGRGEASSVRAEVIPAPLSGVQCFAILDSDGKAVGGNCVKE
jgi:hypothetical protein